METRDFYVDTDTIYGSPIWNWKFIWVRQLQIMYEVFFDYPNGSICCLNLSTDSAHYLRTWLYSHPAVCD